MFVEIEDPRRRRVQDIAFEHFDADNDHEPADQPGGYLARPRADPIDGSQEKQDCQGGARSKPKGRLREKKSTHMGTPDGVS